MAEHNDKPLPIEYQSPRTDVSVGSSRMVRVAAAFIAILLVLLIVQFLGSV